MADRTLSTALHAALSPNITPEQMRGIVRECIDHAILLEDDWEMWRDKANKQSQKLVAIRRILND